MLHAATRVAVCCGILALAFQGGRVCASEPSTLPPIAFVPLDDRPVSLQLPQMIAQFSGLDLRTPPREALGRYLTAGSPDTIVRWLLGDDVATSASVLVSSDMLAYGGLVAARAPEVSGDVAIARLRTLGEVRMHNTFRDPFIGVFGTIMRLAPTGVPKLGDAKDFFAAGPLVDQLTTYANLPDPPRTATDRATATHLRSLLGNLVPEYIAVRRRDRHVDEYLLNQTAEGIISRLVLGQDDAGRTGLHLADIAALRGREKALHFTSETSIEPGADELGMALLAAAAAHESGIHPTISVTYSRSDAATTVDHIEFEPIDTVISDLIRLCGGIRSTDSAHADIALFIHAHATSDADETQFLANVRNRAPDAAVVDLSFIGGSIAEQRNLAEELIAGQLAGKLASFASWNTDANSTGTALSAAVCGFIARKLGGYDARAHAEFMLDRFADDYVYRTEVRPQINAMLTAQKLPETVLLPGTVARSEVTDRALLWPRTLELLRRLYPQYRDAGITIDLPWRRSFETRLAIRLREVSPDIPPKN